jgi:hypothetical protein
MSLSKYLHQKITLNWLILSIWIQALLQSWDWSQVLMAAGKLQRIDIL